MLSFTATEKGINAILDFRNHIINHENTDLIFWSRLISESFHRNLQTDYDKTLAYTLAKLISNYEGSETRESLWVSKCKKKNEQLASKISQKFIYNLPETDLKGLTSQIIIAFFFYYFSIKIVLHLALDHLNRESILERNLRIPRALYGNEDNIKAIIICDGTYIYINKSSNFLLQRQSYSLHKFQNLLKTFIIVTTDGYILDVKGPCSATKTDAQIMSDLMTDEGNPLHILLQANDVFILDRGFRDSLGHIESCGYEYHVPPTKNQGESQLTTSQANDSRLVTICRWVVEVVNGRFKRDFKLLRQKYFNRTMPNTFLDFKIAAAITNHFHTPIEDRPYAEAFLQKIAEKIHTPNVLYNYVEEKRLNNRRAQFQRLEANDVQGFPLLTEQEVMLLSLGTYQLKLAKSYCSELLNNGLYLIEIYREALLEDLNEYGNYEDTWLLRARIQSRHLRAKQYFCYNMNGNIIHHYCTCLTGRRRVGFCAHIVSIVWYLGYARHEGFTEPALFLNSIIIDNAI